MGASHAPPPAADAERRRFILRRGILRYGLAVGTLVFAWVVAGEYSGPMEHLRTAAGWLRLGVILLLTIVVWVLGAGWLVGSGIWFLRQHPLTLAGTRPPDRRSRRRP